MKNKDVGDRLKKILKDKKITQYKLSEITGLHQSVLSEMMSGKRNILPLVEQVSTLFGWSRDYIIAGNTNTISDIGIEYGIKNNGNGLTQEDRLRLTDKLNSLYKRQQEITNELQSIIKETVSINKLLITENIHLPDLK